MEENLGCYVYLLVDPRDGAPFYVGKGTGGRCFAHIDEARNTSADTTGDYGKLVHIRAIEATGHDVRIDILRHGLSEGQAFHVESAAIELLGFTGLTNRVVGQGTNSVGRLSVDDINAQYGAAPAVFDPGDKMILIRVSKVFSKGMSAEALYKGTRHWWRLGERRFDADYAMAVNAGVVRAVYRIDGWEEPTDADVEENPTCRGRHGFYGHIDTDMEDRHLYADVTALLPMGAQNPIKYVNC